MYLTLLEIGTVFARRFPKLQIHILSENIYCSFKEINCNTQLLHNYERFKTLNYYNVHWPMIST